MKKNVKKVIWLVIGLMIGANTIVGAATIFRSEDITYSSPTNKINVKDSLDELYNLTSNYEFYKPLASLVELGDYISMTPTSINYSISTSLTGYDNVQTINPSKLNLWRVIRKNYDGTVDAVSEYISNEEVIFKGKIGYMNYIGALNEITEQYTNKKYVERTRHMGCNGQTEYLTDTSKIDSETPPWSSNTGGADHSEDDEIVGGGDQYYFEDTSLINNIYGTRKGYTVEKIEGDYWLSSRYYTKHSEVNWYFAPLYIDSQGKLQNFSTYYYIGDSFKTEEKGYHIRPILTIKANIEIKSGNGKSAETAYQLN